MLKTAIRHPLPSVQGKVYSRKFMFPSIRAPPVDLIIIISKYITVVYSKLVLIGSKLLRYRNIVWSSHHLSRAGRLLATAFKRFRAWTRSRRSYRKMSIRRSSNCSLPELRRRGAEEVARVGHFGCGYGLLGSVKERKNI
jgi:hypothetical protein